MKKLVATMLAVLMTVGICAVSVIADEPPVGTTYNSLDIVFPISTKNSDKDVTILKPGDTVNFETKTRKLEVTFLSDALNIAAASIKNTTWRDYVNSLGTVSTFASSANKYKSFYYSEDYSPADFAGVTIPDINSEDDVYEARDKSNYIFCLMPIY